MKEGIAVCYETGYSISWCTPLMSQTEGWTNLSKDATLFESTYIEGKKKRKKEKKKERKNERMKVLILCYFIIEKNKKSNLVVLIFFVQFPNAF